MGPRLRELAPMAGGSQDAGSRNLWVNLLAVPVSYSWLRRRLYLVSGAIKIESNEDSFFSARLLLLLPSAKQAPIFPTCGYRGIFSFASCMNPRHFLI